MNGLTIKERARVLMVVYRVTLRQALRMMGIVFADGRYQEGL